MQRTTMGNEPTPAAGAAPQTFREQVDQAKDEDSTTIKFEGRIGVSSDDDSGGDPYNHTGRFRRNVR